MNYKFFKFCLISILLVFFIGYSFAQKNNRASMDSSVTEEEDSINNDYENPADTQIIKGGVENTTDSIIKWRASREFGYMAYLDSMLRKKTDLRIDTFSIDKGTLNKTRSTTNLTTYDNSNRFLNSFGVKVFFWLIAILFVGFILYKLFFIGGLFTKGNIKSADESAHKEPEVLNDHSAYNLLIHDAESKNDFNLSIRYLYMQSLRKLVDNELISFSPDKTNNMYVRELSGRSYQQEFVFLTLNYEYVWYGKFMVNRTQYQKLKEGFILFNKKVQ